MNASALEMKYADSKYSFIILLPWNRKGLSTLETKLKNFNLTKHFNLIDLHKSNVDVKIPKFKTEISIKLNDVLEKVCKHRVIIFFIKIIGTKLIFLYLLLLAGHG